LGKLYTGVAESEIFRTGSRVTPVDSGGVVYGAWKVTGVIEGRAVIKFSVCMGRGV